ncbi:DUF6328 family protein [Streptomyces sp. NPDC057686]|uniref:DUF6328 family protein n=1 Tax=Streptomyces sp. NPDC057686 TaxID=3346212 RepID=UPI00367988AE
MALTSKRPTLRPVPGQRIPHATPDDPARRSEERLEQDQEKACAELLQEVRLAQTGVQILLGFLMAFAFAGQEQLTAPGGDDGAGRREVGAARGRDPRWCGLAVVRHVAVVPPAVRALTDARYEAQARPTRPGGVLVSRSIKRIGHPDVCYCLHETG